MSAEHAADYHLGQRLREALRSRATIVGVLLVVVGLILFASHRNYATLLLDVGVITVLLTFATALAAEGGQETQEREESGDRPGKADDTAGR